MCASMSSSGEASANNLELYSKRYDLEATHIAIVSSTPGSVSTTSIKSQAYA